jgi:L-lactate dehydrogenase complex protein LldG
MASRDDILRAVRTHLPPPADLPEIEARGVVYADRPKQFAAMVEAVGGRCAFAADVAEVNRSLETMPEVITALRIVSLVDGAGTPNVDLNDINDPHDLADVDFAVLPGQFGVAENGAVWVTDEGVKHRAIFFIAQHVALVFAAADILDNMHQAYDRLSFDKPGFGAFISGPSKTADIEQSLVIGAHGPRSLTVFCIGAKPDAGGKA